MLILTREKGESVLLSGGITVHVIEIRGERVRLGFTAPAHIKIAREEIARHIDGNPDSWKPITEDD